MTTKKGMNELYWSWTMSQKSSHHSVKFQKVNTKKIKLKHYQLHGSKTKNPYMEIQCLLHFNLSCNCFQCRKYLYSCMIKCSQLQWINEQREAHTKKDISVTSEHAPHTNFGFHSVGRCTWELSPAKEK